MTKKGFEAIAKALASTQNDLPPAIYWQLCQRIAVECSKVNPKFNRAIFLAACGLSFRGK